MTARIPQVNDRVHWRTGIGDGFTGRIVALQGTPSSAGTMIIEWDDGRIWKHQPQRLLDEPRWSLLGE